jgi:hypothetical protein
VLIEAEAFSKVRDLLRAEHFFSEAHRRIFEACSALAADGKPVEIVGVATWLRDGDRLSQVGGMAYLTELLAAAPTVTHVRRYAEIVADKRNRRQLIVSCQLAIAQAYAGGETSTASLLADHSEHVGQLRATHAAAREPLPSLSLEELSAPPSATPWVCESLCIAPGRPTLVAGYGYSRKTVALQDLALAVALGTCTWGVFACRRGRVRHLDYEQGRELTRDRYQRLARGRGRELAEVGDDFPRVSCFPNVYLSDDCASDFFARALDGYTLCLIDSLAAATCSIEEKDSRIRRCLDALTRASEKTGCAVVVIHHARKPPKDEPEGTKFSIRGSSALFDAAGSVFVFSGSKGEPTQVQHVKEPLTGRPLDEFHLDTADVDGPNGERRWGLRVVHLDPEQLRKPGRRASRAVDKIAVAEKAVLDALQLKPGASKRMLRELVDGVRASTVDAALEQLIAVGRVRDDGDKRGGRFYLAS